MAGYCDAVGFLCIRDFRTTARKGLLLASIATINNSVLFVVSTLNLNFHIS
ncbi:unnamed protein product [Brugia timori]|uniref:7TM_GPCR_Srx domain-containing protein n=1 Tax=Brugia timori TaxID=42155 RepID=A0A0R3QBV9_9BILA|nr:unnamed protein product [Brugia timori]